MIGDPPRVVARALARGWTTRRIVNAYPVPSAHVRIWRWRARVTSPAARRSAEASGVPVGAVVRRLAAGDTLKAAARATGAPWDATCRAAYDGAYLYPPRERYPCPQVWALAARRHASRLRRDLAAAMRAAGLQTSEIAEICGVSPRAVRYWRTAHD